MASRGQLRRIPELESRIDNVQCDAFAEMKIIKHCHEASLSNMEVAHGALLGFVIQNRLEITNCFPFPKNDELMEEDAYQRAVMRGLRRVNVDHFHVGWYQGANIGNFLNLPLLKSQYHYQTSIEDSVVVIYDTAKSARGITTLKAYRLTPQAIQMYKEGEFTPEALRTLKIGYETLFVEIPIVIRNRSLPNIMLSELEEMILEEEGTKYFNLGTARVLQNQLRCLMNRVDESNQEAIEFNRFPHLAVRQQQDENRVQENAATAATDEPPLPDDDINTLMRPLPVPPRLNPMIVAGQINTYSQDISQSGAQSLTKLHITQSLQR